MEDSPLANLLSEGSIGERLNNFEIIESPETLVKCETLVKWLQRSPKVADELKSLNDVELAKKAVSMGLRRLGLSDDKLNELLIPLTEMFGVDKEPHESLASLMSSTQFGDIPPRLEAGIVLENKDEYWLCIQPLCDSVRLKGPRKFPLLPLVKQGSEAMIRAGDGAALAVSFSKPYELLVTEFEPSGDEESVLAQREDPEGNDWYFEANQTRYRAVCRLRSEFTQQAVQKFTSGVARAGVDSSEWLRRSGRR